MPADPPSRPAQRGDTGIGALQAQIEHEMVDQIQSSWNSWVPRPKSPWDVESTTPSGTRTRA